MILGMLVIAQLVADVAEASVDEYMVAAKSMVAADAASKQAAAKSADDLGHVRSQSHTRTAHGSQPFGHTRTAHSSHPCAFRACSAPHR